MKQAVAQVSIIQTNKKYVSREPENSSEEDCKFQ